MCEKFHIFTGLWGAANKMTQTKILISMVAILLLLAGCKSSSELRKEAYEKQSQEKEEVHKDMRIMRAAFLNKEYVKVRKMARGYADRGERFIFAHYSLGRIYLEGLGVPKDTETGVKYLETASKKGQMQADYHLAKYYMFIEANPEGFAKAREYLERVLENKKRISFSFAFSIRHSSMYLIGHLYENGLGMAQSDKQVGLDWYRRAANKGYSYAQYKVGEAYYKGAGYVQNYRFAESWLKLAADQGNADAMRLLAKIFDDGNGTIQDKSIANMYLEKAKTAPHRVSDLLKY